MHRYILDDSSVRITEMFLEKFTQRFKEGNSELTPIESELIHVREVIKRLPPWNSVFENRYLTYLEFAHMFGLTTRNVVDSCFDLALTYDPFFKEVETEKQNFWEARRQKALQVTRPPRKIQMQLYPGYFSAILRGEKPFEGRAYDPVSEKRYEDIRAGDRIVFNICQETQDWEAECERLGLNPLMLMELTVVDVYFAPRVHWMYQYTNNVGADFQPMITGPSELLALQRAGVYYTIPGYKEKIDEYGFIGIEIENPRLIN